MVIKWKTNIPRSIYAKLYCDWKRVRREVGILLEIFRKYNVRRVIEFGCGIGRHGYLLRKMGFNVLLTDVVDWRYGVSKKLPFIQLDVLNNDVNVTDNFDAGYGLNFLTLFDDKDMITVLWNLSRIVENGILVFDYNFTVYREPVVREVVVNGEKYYAVLMKQNVRKINDGVVYRYLLKIFDRSGNIVGIERGEYPIYNRDKFFEIINNTGLKIIDIVWVSWDPVEYVYKPSSSDSDSVFVVLKKH